MSGARSASLTMHGFYFSRAMHTALNIFLTAFGVFAIGYTLYLIHTDPPPS